VWLYCLHSHTHARAKTPWLLQELEHLQDRMGKVGDKDGSSGDSSGGGGGGGGFLKAAIDTIIGTVIPYAHCGIAMRLPACMHVY
jgi:hypothetical protein